VTFGPAIVLAPLFLEHGHGAGPPLFHDFAGDAGLPNDRVAEPCASVPGYEQDSPQRNSPAHLSCQTLDLENLTLGGTILFAAGFDNRVHHGTPLDHELEEKSLYHVRENDVKKLLSFFTTLYNGFVVDLTDF
jgi:hypothetical protein